MGGKVIVIESPEHWETTRAKAKEGGQMIVVDFFAEWCPPCRLITPYFEDLSTEMEDVIFVKVDVDGAPQIASEYGISAMPTFMVFLDGRKVDELIGADKGRLKSLILQHRPNVEKPAVADA